MSGFFYFYSVIETCIILGTGNVAHHLLKAFVNSNIEVLQIYGRSDAKALELANAYGLPYTSDKDNVLNSADLYLLCVSDSVILEVAQIEALRNKFLVHTAGSVHLDVLQTITPSRGVMYPLQSFSKFRELNYSQIPFFIEASTPEFAMDLKQFVSKISNNVVEMNSSERLYLHLAAVIASNFTNHMYAIAGKLLEQHNIDFSILRPLILETAQKVMFNYPIESQTGPAVRNNVDVMNKHIDMLSKTPEWQKIYTFVSESILKLKENN